MQHREAKERFQTKGLVGGLGKGNGNCAGVYTLLLSLLFELGVMQVLQQLALTRCTQAYRNRAEGICICGRDFESRLRGQAGERRETLQWLDVQGALQGVPKGSVCIGLP